MQERRRGGRRPLHPPPEYQTSPTSSTAQQHFFRIFKTAQQSIKGAHQQTNSTSLEYSRQTAQQKNLGSTAAVQAIYVFSLIIDFQSSKSRKMQK